MDGAIEFNIGFIDSSLFEHAPYFLALPPVHRPSPCFAREINPCLNVILRIGRSACEAYPRTNVTLMRR
jgi:hypothetical protein